MKKIVSRFLGLLHKDTSETQMEAVPRIEQTGSTAAMLEAAPHDGKEQEPFSKSVTYKVTGLSHYEKNILSLAERNDDYKMSKKQIIAEDLVDIRIWEYEFHPRKAEMVPEPDNSYDHNAIKVLVDGLQVGYIKAGSCAHLLRVIQENRVRGISVKMGGGRYKCVEAVDDDSCDSDEYELNRDELPWWVHLNIIEEKPYPA